MPDNFNQQFSTYACGDLIDDFIVNYKKQFNTSFFKAYIKAIKNNQRMDTKEKSSLIIHEDSNVIVFIPKAQTSQWEVQIMTKKSVGNILEADQDTRFSIDNAMYKAIKALGGNGAKMVTSIEYSKNFHNTDSDQRLIYALLPRLPNSPGAFSETQLRWINRHYPEDFAATLNSRCL